MLPGSYSYFLVASGRTARFERDNCHSGKEWCQPTAQAPRPSEKLLRWTAADQPREFCYPVYYARS
jgi:hypothetical protein